MRVMEHWHKLSRKAVNSPSLDIFKNHWYAVLSNLLQVALLEKGFGLHNLQRTPSASAFL